MNEQILTTGATKITEGRKHLHTLTGAVIGCAIERKAFIERFWGQQMKYRCNSVISAISVVKK